MSKAYLEELNVVLDGRVLRAGASLAHVGCLRWIVVQINLNLMVKSSFANLLCDGMETGLDSGMLTFSWLR